MLNLVDLHTHSTASDGTYSPTELIEYAVRKDLKTIALTDHDTIAGLDEAHKKALELNISLVPGIELSTEYNGKDIHILGLFIDWKKDEFVKSLSDFKDSRSERNLKMLALLKEDAGFDISPIQLQNMFGHGVTLTRAHVARYMLEKGYIKSIDEAFKKYIGDDCKYFIPREKITPAQAIEFIKKGNGISILAHPLLYKLSNRELDILINSLKTLGLQGIEAIYSRNKGFEEVKVRQLAKKYNLLISGGSDFHGQNKPEIDLGVGYGGLKIPYSVYESLLDHTTHLS